MKFVEPLLAWYAASHRDLPWRRTQDPYAIWVSEIMLQQTRVAAVVPYYERFLLAYPTVTALAQAQDEQLFKLWQGLGYYTRARNLKRAAQCVIEKHAGVMPHTYETLLTLPGIGSYTAAAIASIAFSERVPAVDGNVLRVFARLFDDDGDVTLPATKRRVFDALLAAFPKDAGACNQALMELGACVCVPNGTPLCDACPLAACCLAKQNGTVALRPVKTPKRKRTVVFMTVFVLRCGERFLVRKRPDSGLLASLYELPNVTGTRNAEEIQSAWTAMGVHPVGDITLFARKHIFTHIEWQMQVVTTEISDALPAGWVWYDGSQSLPTAFSVCLS